MKDEAQSVGKCGLWLCAFKGWRELKFKAFVGFELKLASFWLWLTGCLNLREKLALAFAVIFVATAVFCMS